MPFEMLSDKPKETKRKAFLTLTPTRGAGIAIHMDKEVFRIVNTILPSNEELGAPSGLRIKPVSYNLGYDKNSREILIEVQEYPKGEYDGQYQGENYYFTSQSLSKVMGHPEVSKYILVNQEKNKLYFAPAQLEDYFD